MPDTVPGWWSNVWSARLVGAALALLAIALAVRALRGVVARHVADADARYSARKLVTLAGYAAMIAVLAFVFSDRLGGLTVAFGVAGAGVAFALQEVIASVAGWLAVSFGGFFKVGDRVQLGGIKGDVIDISVLRTTVMECGEWIQGDIYTGRVVRIANSFVLKEPVFNYSGDFPFLWDEIRVPVKYGSDHRRARALLERVAAEHAGEISPPAAAAWQEMTRRYRLEDTRLEPVVSLSANDNWIEFAVRYVVDYRARRATRDRLFTRILEEFDATGGAVAIASATFHLVETPPIEVRLRS